MTHIPNDRTSVRIYLDGSHYFAHNYALLERGGEREGSTDIRRERQRGRSTEGERLTNREV